MIGTPSRRAMAPRRRPLGDMGLALGLAAMFLASWTARFIVETVVVRNRAESHAESFSWGEFWPHLWQSTLENWQSEFLQLLTFVTLTTYLVFRGSPETKDSDDAMQAALKRIAAELDELHPARPSTLAWRAPR